MNTVKCKVLVSLFALWLGYHAYAGGIDHAAEFYAKVERLESLSADFEQRSFDHEGFLLQTSKGQLRLQRPNRVYWETLPPYEQIIVGNSDVLWVYDPDLEQATYKPGSEALAGPLTLLSQSLEELKNTYDIGSANAENGEVFLLTPRDTATQSNFSQLEMHFVDDLLNSITIIDRLRQKSEISLANTEINQPIPAKTFEFEVPEGVEVVTNE